MSDGLMGDNLQEKHTLTARLSSASEALAMLDTNKEKTTIDGSRAALAHR